MRRSPSSDRLSQKSLDKWVIRRVPQPYVADGADDDKLIKAPRGLKNPSTFYYAITVAILLLTMGLFLLQPSVDNIHPLSIQAVQTMPKNLRSVSRVRTVATQTKTPPRFPDWSDASGAKLIHDNLDEDARGGIVGEPKKKLDGASVQSMRKNGHVPRQHVMSPAGDGGQRRRRRPHSLGQVSASSEPLPEEPVGVSPSEPQHKELPAPSSNRLLSGLVSRAQDVSVHCDVAGSRGPCSVLTQDPPGEDWSHDRWQASAEDGLVLEGAHWVVLDFGRPTHAQRLVLDWETAFAEAYRVEGRLNVSEALVGASTPGERDQWDLIYDGLADTPAQQYVLLHVTCFCVGCLGLWFVLVSW